MKIDLTGKRFGRLTVIKEVSPHYSKSGVRMRMWECKCDCGNNRILSTSNITNGNTKSCGCLKKELLLSKNTTHGMSKTKLYSVWGSMKDRCFNENVSQFSDYGGRGISVCNEWKNDFQAFYDWAIGNGYKDGLTIERKDVNGDYCPENCCWITREEQSKNRRNSHFITYRGETKTLSEWSRELHIDRECVRNQEKKLGSGEEAIKAVLNSRKHKEKIRSSQLVLLKVSDDKELKVEVE